MKNIVLTTLVLGIALLGLQASASANLLTDPSFENYSGSWAPLGWTDSPWYGGGGGGIEGNFEIGGGAGITYLHASSGSRSALLYQYGTVADGQTWGYAVVGQKNILPISGNTTYTASASAKRLGTLGNAQGYLKVTWLNSLGAFIADASTATQLTDSDPLDTWIPISDNFTSPATAAKAKFEIVFDRSSMTEVDPADVVVDAVGFDVIPEPASLLLLGSGLVGLVAFGKKKRS